MLWRWEGLAFGNTTPDEDPDSDGIETTFNLRFPGQYHDPESALYYNWNRYYEPRIGRYITSDPLGLFPGAVYPRMFKGRFYMLWRLTSYPTNAMLRNRLDHLYVYVRNNPGKFIDPNGLVSCTAFVTAGLYSGKVCIEGLEGEECPPPTWCRTYKRVCTK